MSAFAVAAFFADRLAPGTTGLDAVIQVRASGLGSRGCGVALSVWTPVGARVADLRAIAPDRVELPGVRVDERTRRFDAGRWTDGVYELELALELPARRPGEEMLAARVGVVAGEEEVGSARLGVRWTDRADAVAAAGSDAPSGTVAVTLAHPPAAVPRPLPAAGAGGPCGRCGELAEPGDRFCEACGHGLAAG